MAFLFANVTSLSNKVMDYISLNKGRYHLVGTAEHKKLPEDLVEVQDKFINMGYKSWWTQAVRTDAGGVSGGTSLHASSYFTAQRLDWAELPRGSYLPADPKNWTGTVIHGAIN